MQFELGIWGWAYSIKFIMSLLEENVPSYPRHKFDLNIYRLLAADGFLK